MQIWHDKVNSYPFSQITVYLFKSFTSNLIHCNTLQSSELICINFAVATINFVSHGRYSKDTFQQLCPLCEANATGDEFPYLLVCPAFNEARKRYPKRHYWENPSVHEMNEPLNVGNVG